MGRPYGRAEREENVQWTFLARSQLAGEEMNLLPFFLVRKMPQACQFGRKA
jgi:hypothetical protein